MAENPGMAERPDWVHCIADTHQDNIGKSLCGRQIGGTKAVPRNAHPGDTGTVKELVPSEWCFVGVDHWFIHRRNQGRLLGCEECVAEVARVCADGGDDNVAGPKGGR